MPSPRALRLAPRLLAQGAEALTKNDLRGAAAAATELLGLLPDHPDGLLLRGLVRLRAGDAAGSRADLGRCLGIDPERPGAWVNLGRACFAGGDLEAARAAGREALARKPELVEAWLLLAHVELAAGALPAARAAAEAVLFSRPQSVEAHQVLGAAAAGLGDAATALESLTHAARLGPSPARWRAVAGQLLATGDPETALVALSNALELDPEDGESWAAFGDALLLVPAAPEPARRWLLPALGRPEVDRALLGPVCVAALDPDAPEADPLLEPSLRHCLWRGRAAMALLDRLRGRVDLSAQDRLAGRLPWPLPERRVPVLGTLPEDAVRRQYEEDPYPRLITVPAGRPRPFSVAIRDLLGIEVPDRPAVLVAGCGTGRHVRVTLARFEVGSLLAIDLSAASLAVAAEALADRPEVELGQADLVRVGELGRAFDFVDSVGVVHHLADPAAGIAALRGVTRPGGLLRIGVYSRRAREGIRAAQALVADLAPDAAGLEAALARLLALPDDDPAAAALRSVDCWTRAGRRDLLFHPREAEYAPSEIPLGDLEVLGIQPTHPRARAWYAEAFPQDLRQADLRRWDEVERLHPEVFAGMIVVWARRPERG